jgi:Cu(I)/Ag(I) efflux system membrane fusion protein
MILGAIVIALVVVFHGTVVAWFGGKPVSGGGAGSAVSAQAGAFHVSAALDPDPPRQEGAVALTITDAAGQPVDDAHLTADYDMPAMGAMQEMKGSAKVSAQGGGRYRVDFTVPMGGTWGLDVAIAKAGASTTVHYHFTTGTSGLTTDGTNGATAAAGTVTIAQDRRDAFGIRVAPAISAPMHAQVRAVGKVAYDETHLSDVTLKLKGWITHLDVNATGQQVKRGQRMLTIYSPDLYAAEQEYLLAVASGPSTEALANAAKKKLTLWGLTDAQVADLAKRGEPLEDVPITAPASGYVIEKDVVEGGAVDAGQRLFRIAALDDVWVEADVFEGDLPLVQQGQAATITLSYLPGRTFDGKVAFVYPYLDPQTRTGRVRVTLPNKDGALKPDMYANVALDVDLGTRVQIPIGAVVYTGTRRIVLVDLGSGAIQPVEVQLGARTDDAVEVVSGLTAGQKIVVAGNFLVAAESRLRSAAFWNEEGDHAGH